MSVTPETDLFLLKCPLQLSNKHQLSFNNETSQHNYFLSLPKLEVDNISYQRHNNVIRYPAHIDTLLEYNYVMYQNENYGNKWFYAFIVGMTYVNDNRTDIQITTDCWQTWQFNLTYLESFVERDMINPEEDIPGANLVPEQLEIGELKIQNTYNIHGIECIAVIAYTSNPNEDGLTNIPFDNIQGTKINGIPQGLFYCVCGFNALAQVLYDINKKGKGQNIMSIFTIPKLALLTYLNGQVTLDYLDNDNISFWIPQGANVAPFYTYTLPTTPTTIDGYTPINNKLRTYPYMYIGFNPNHGTSKVFRYEDFEGSPVFKFLSEINPNPTIAVIPSNYRNGGENSLNDHVTINGYPTLSWVTDYFNTWLAQNSNIVNLQLGQEEIQYGFDQTRNSVNMVGNLIGGVLSLNPNTVTGAANNALDLAERDANHEFYIKNTMAQVEKQMLLPNSGTQGSSNATLLGYKLFDNNIISVYTIKKQFAERIDKYFSAFGYQMNKFKIPDVNNRPNWNYVKTQGINIKANIPQMDLQIIKEMFDNGLTIWHNPTTFMDYSQINK